MDLQINDSLIESYQRDGAVCLRRVFTEEWLQKVSSGIEKNLLSPSEFSEKLPAGQGYYFNDYTNWRNIPEFQDYVFNSPAAGIVQKLMKTTRTAFYHEHVLIKEPGALKETPWHFDQAYYPIDGFKVCSIWMPIDPVPLATTIEFVAGSHLWPQWFRPKKFATGLNYQEISEEAERVYKDVPSGEELRRDHRIVKWSVEPGDCIVFHMKTLHGAPGNTSLTTSRRVLSTRWFGDDAVIARRAWEVSPPTTGGLAAGQSVFESSEFPLIS